MLSTTLDSTSVIWTLFSRYGDDGTFHSLDSPASTRVTMITSESKVYNDHWIMVEA